VIFEVWVEGEEPVVLPQAALESAWAETQREQVDKALQLEVGGVLAVIHTPEIFVRRVE